MYVEDDYDDYVFMSCEGDSMDDGDDESFGYESGEDFPVEKCEKLGEILTRDLNKWIHDELPQEIGPFDDVIIPRIIFKFLADFVRYYWPPYNENILRYACRDDNELNAFSQIDINYRLALGHMSEFLEDNIEDFHNTEGIELTTKINVYVDRFYAEAREGLARDQYNLQQIMETEDANRRQQLKTAYKKQRNQERNEARKNKKQKTDA